MKRRRFLATTGIATLTSLAGCSGGENGSSSDGGGSEGNESGGSSNDSGGESNESNESSSEGSNEEASEALVDEDQESTVEGLEILEHELVEDDFGATIEGVVVNGTGRMLDYVEVGVVLYNAEDQRIGDSFTNTQDLRDGEEWVFEVYLLEEPSEVEDYTIAVTDSPF